MASNTSTRLITETEAAEILGLKPATLRRWRWGGGGPEFVRVGARAVRYHPDVLAAFIADGVCTSTSDAGVGR